MMKYKDVNFYREVVNVETVNIIVVGTAKLKEIFELAKIFVEDKGYRTAHIFAEDIYKNRYYDFSYNKVLGRYEVLSCETHF